MSPTISDRIKNITVNGSDGWEVFNKARRMISNGEKVIELSIGEHDIEVNPYHDLSTKIKIIVKSIKKE